MIPVQQAEEDATAAAWRPGAAGGEAGEEQERAMFGLGVEM